MKVPDKIYLTPLMLFATPQISNGENDVEYIRTDVFIEKACEWLKENGRSYWMDDYDLSTDKLVDDFKNYMNNVMNI